MSKKSKVSSKYLVVTVFVFAANSPATKTPVESREKKSLSSAITEAKRSVRSHECPFHPNFGYTASLVKDEQGKFVAGFIGYRDGEVKELKLPRR